MPNNMSTTPVRETTWTKIVDGLEEPVGNALEFTKKHEDATVFGIATVGILLSGAFAKYDGFRRHFIAPAATLATAGATALLAEGAYYDYADGEYVSGGLKAVGAVATGVTAADIGTYYLHDVLGIKVVPRIPFYGSVLVDKAPVFFSTIAGTVIVAGGLMCYLALKEKNETEERANKISELGSPVSPVQ